MRKMRGKRKRNNVAVAERTRLSNTHIFNTVLLLFPTGCRIIHGRAQGVPRFQVTPKSPSP